MVLQAGKKYGLCIGTAKHVVDGRLDYLYATTPLAQTIPDLVPLSGVDSTKIITEFDIAAGASVSEVC